VARTLPTFRALPPLVIRERLANRPFFVVANSREDAAFNAVRVSATIFDSVIEWGGMAPEKPALTSARTTPESKGTPARFISPMLLRRADALPASNQWLYELKLDGYRAIAFKRQGTVYLRRGTTNTSALGTQPW
jgi:ATP-dependent DNA ligase